MSTNQLKTIDEAMLDGVSGGGGHGGYGGGGLVGAALSLVGGLVHVGVAAVGGVLGLLFGRGGRGGHD